MVNKTTIKVPQYLQFMVEEIFQDGEGGYWIYAKPGFYFTENDMGSHMVRESTQKYALQMIRSLNRCYCNECNKGRQKQ